MRSLLVLAMVACSDPATGGPDGSPGPDALDGDTTLDDAPGEWTWVPMAGTQCGNGTPAGFGINWQPGATSLALYMEGGGACFDNQSCFVTPTAIGISGDYTAQTFAGTLGFLQQFLGRDNRPWAQSHLVYVPYCTGDLHSGTTAQTFAGGTVNFKGGDNMAQFVAALHAAMPSLEQVWLLGSSAGGYGVAFNTHRFRAAWNSARVDILQDSAPLVEPMFDPSQLVNVWQSASIPGCATCPYNFDATMMTLPSDRTRVALISSMEDQTLRFFFFNNGAMSPAMNTLLDAHFGQANAHGYIVAGTRHVFLNSLDTFTSDGESLRDWVSAWASGDAAWTTLRP